VPPEAFAVAQGTIFTLSSKKNYPYVPVLAFCCFNNHVGNGCGAGKVSYENNRAAV
jgi:hypothetical protein